MRSGDLYYLIYGTASKKVGKDVDYAIAKKDGYIYLMFRGTNSGKDVFVDINFPAKLYKTQKNKFFAHRGFGDAWKSANDFIMNDFITERKCNPNLKVRIIGHSLGGAMAILAAEDYYYRTKEKADVIVFGSPRVLCYDCSIKYFLSCINSIKEFSYNNDPVPKLPPLFYHLNEIKVGEKYNIIKATKDAVYYHTLYGTLDIQI